jgi:hypothetical protein
MSAGYNDAMPQVHSCSGCGGRLSASADGRVVACPYCGSSESVAIDPRALAAGLAGDHAALHAGFERLLDVFRQTLPSHTTVRESGMLFKKVSGFDVVLDETTFRLTRHSGKLEATRVTTVRGITLKNETLPLEEWLTALAEKLSAMAGASAAARTAFARIADQ